MDATLAFLLSFLSVDDTGFFASVDGVALFAFGGVCSGGTRGLVQVVEVDMVAAAANFGIDMVAAASVDGVAGAAFFPFVGVCLGSTRGLVVEVDMVAAADPADLLGVEVDCRVGCFLAPIAMPTLGTGTMLETGDGEVSEVATRRVE